MKRGLRRKFLQEERRECEMMGKERGGGKQGDEMVGGRGGSGKRVLRKYEERKLFERMTFF